MLGLTTLGMNEITYAGVTTLGVTYPWDHVPQGDPPLGSQTSGVTYPWGLYPQGNFQSPTPGVTYPRGHIP